MENWPYVATANRACSLLYSYIKEHSSGKWILPVNVCPDVPLTFSLAGIPFVFVDINPDTLCVDIGEVLHRLNNEPTLYSGILYVRTYGYIIDTSSEFGAIKSINSNLKIIDDRCLCIPECNPNFWGADMILYSTGHCKQIDFNGGGIAYYNELNAYIIDGNLIYEGTDEEKAYKEAFNLGTPLKKVPTGWLKMENYLTPDDYLNSIKDKIPKRESRRKRLNSIYSEFLPTSISMAPEFQSWRFNIRVESSQKNIIMQRLFDNGLFASSHYHSANRLFDTNLYPVSDSLYESVINLFNDEYYSEDKAYRTCLIINDVI